MDDNDAIRRVPSEDEEILEEWERLTSEPDVRGVGAARRDDDEWPWSVDAWVMEFVREEPLQGELRDRILHSLFAVPGVTAVAEQDRGVWMVAGAPDGEALVSAAARIVDELAARIRAHLARD